MYSKYYQSSLPEELGKLVEHGSRFTQVRHKTEVPFLALEYFIPANPEVLDDFPQISDAMVVFLNLVNNDHNWVPETETDIIFAKEVERIIIFMSEEDYEWFETLTDPAIPNEDDWKRVCNLARQSDGYALSLMRSLKLDIVGGK